MYNNNIVIIIIIIIILQNILYNHKYKNNIINK